MHRTKRDFLLFFCLVLRFVSSWAFLAASNNKNIILRPKTKHYAASDDDFMAALRTRVKEVEDRESKLPMVVVDSMLPRQVLKIQVKNNLLMELVKECLQNETPFFGMLGLARLSSGQQVHLKHGVEVEIVGKPEVIDGGGMKLELIAGRRFSIEGEVDNAGKGWTEARVRFLDSEEQEADEVKGVDRLSVARAIAKATGLTCPNMIMPDRQSLIDRWIELATENEKKPGQIARLLEQIGEIPPPEEPTERALWVGALINPIPAMGVAMEVRPQLLIAKKAEDRVQLALDGILKSIKHMDGSARMW
jgi:Lon protease-like protein